jgi:3'(2'), 5'-bisphosphate nucleotidase
MEWDTGAGHAIAQISGATVFNHETRQPLRYNKDNLLNPWFVVER